jgi:hypothetical protein
MVSPDQVDQEEEGVVTLHHHHHPLVTIPIEDRVEIPLDGTLQGQNLGR